MDWQGVGSPTITLHIRPVIFIFFGIFAAFGRVLRRQSKKNFLTRIAKFSKNFRQKFFPGCQNRCEAKS
jgi:hypothetical protein